MGFRLNRTYKLRWADGTALAGLEVDIKSTPIGALQNLRDSSTPQDWADLLAEYVVRWNYEDEAGAVLPIEADSFMLLEEPVLAAIGVEWIKAGRGVTAPLDMPSPSGESYPEGDIPMAPASSSPS